MKQPIFKLTEHQVQTELINYLRIKGWMVMRLNSGKYSVGEGRNRRFIMGQEAGTPDLMCFKKITYRANPALMLMVEKTQLLFIEVKIPGNKPTALQAAKMKELEEYGAKCLVIHSIKELQEAGL